MENQNNNESSTFNKVNVTTNSLTMFDENGIMLRIAFFNETYSLTFCIPETTPEGKRKYPAETRHSFIITADRVAALYQNIIIDKVLPAIAEKRGYWAGIFLDNKKKDRVFEIRAQNEDIYAIFYLDIDADRHPKKSLVYKFAKSPIIEKYNPESGEFEMPEAHSQFLLFVKTLEGFLLCINGITSHSARYTNKYLTDKIFKQIEEISVKLGIPITSARTSPFGNTDHSSDADNSLPAMSEATSLEGLLLQ